MRQVGSAVGLGYWYCVCVLASSVPRQVTSVGMRWNVKLNDLSSTLVVPVTGCCVVSCARMFVLQEAQHTRGLNTLASDPPVSCEVNRMLGSQSMGLTFSSCCKRDDFSARSLREFKHTLRIVFERFIHEINKCCICQVE
jgi:hypothetical protein